MNKKHLSLYAEFAVKIGVGLKVGQTLIINSPIEGAEFARALATIAYDAGAREVVVHYADEQLSRIRMEHTEESVLCDVKPYVQDSYLQYIKAPGGACVLNILSRDPEIFKGLDAQKIDNASKARQYAMEEFRSLTMNDEIQWSIVAIPSLPWATKVFPQLPPEEAVEKLWETIFLVTRVSNGVPVSDWKDYINRTIARRELLNAHRFDRLHLTAANGTDLMVGLADDHIWDGSQSETPTGNKFIANIPTEEIFTCPHKDRVNGIVYGSKPYVYNGNLIENFCLEFENGLVVRATAEKGGELLNMLINSDEGAARIGEMALVPASSPLNQCGLLFYNTLFDENASCHIALGRAYPSCIEGGNKMSQQELAQKGANYSVIHEDVMIGTSDMNILGIKQNGEQVQVFQNGEFVL